LNSKLKRLAFRVLELESFESFLMFGSNLGDRYGFLKKGFDLVSHLPEVKLISASRIYETEPVEIIDQPLFLNIAARISTSLTPLELLAKLKEIETAVGRMARERWREREIDIDIIFYGDEKFETKELTIPHPRAHLRRFVLQPLNEIATDYVHPVLHKTVNQLLNECEDASATTRINEPSLLVS